MVFGRSSFRALAPAFGLALLVACGKSSSSPSSQAVTDFTTGVQSSDGTANGVLSSHGSPPAANGGPAVTVSASGTSSSSTVVNGGSSIVHLHAASSFSTVFMSVIDDPLDGFFTLNLPAATTDTFVVVQLGRTIPVNTFQTVFSVKTPGGQVGASGSIANTVNTSAATGQVQVTASWDVNSDVDLHVIEPSGTEIFFLNLGPTASGGTQDVDSICGSNGNVENTRWTSNAPNGTYVVRLDYFNSCGVSATNWVVTVNNGGSNLIKTGTFTGFGDSGLAGSGTTVFTFTHSGTSLTTQEAPTAPVPLSPAALAKRARALTGGR